MGLDRFRSNRASPDYTYISLVALLTLFGLVMISSSSIVISLETYDQNYVFVIKQAIALVIGLIAAIIVSKIQYRQWRNLAPPFFLISFLLLLVVFIPGIGKVTKGAARWIDFGIFQLQPSELLKISFILYLATWLEKRGNLIKSFERGFLPFILLLLPIVILLMAQKDMGTLLVILTTASVMFFVAGATKLQLWVGTISGVALVALLIAMAPYRLERLTTFLNPGMDKLGSGYHINQSLIAIGSGGLWGRGFGQSLQKYLYLPEPHTDSIFAIVVEELGFMRSLVVLALIGLLAYRGYQIALRAGDDYGRLVAFGITSGLLVQSMINVAAILGLVPLTGVPLPLISYGGTSLIMTLLAVGIIVNISRHGYGE